jgi:tetratricopeptide (TPR) repeat protein
VRDLAEQQLRLATVEPVGVLARAAGLPEAARRSGDWAASSVASRALGVAAVQLGDLPAAVRHLRTAVAAALRSTEPELAGQARMSLAFALVQQGRTADAFAEIDLAVDRLDGLLGARARVQRAALLHEVGRLDEALEEYGAALPVLRRHGDPQWETRLLSNRGLLHATRRSFAAARADLEAAAALCAGHDLGFAAAFVEQNLGTLEAQRGDVPAALRHFELAEDHYRRLGVEEGTLLVDRAELLLTTRLLDEARANAEAAVRSHEQQGRGNHVPEAQLLLSAVALVQGDTATALAASEQARAGFARLHRREWLVLAQYACQRARLAAGHAVTPGQVRRTAERLAAAGWTVHALEARVLAGQLALERGRIAQARRDFATASRARSYGPADSRARAWYAEALLRRADGRRRAAATAVAAGLRVVEAHRATLGATELRAHVSVHRGALARLGLRMALEDGDARRVLTWAERGRATSALLRPARPPEDEVLARDLADLRATVAELDDARLEGRPTAPLEARQVALERAVCERCRTASGARDDGCRPRTARELAADLGGCALVEYVELDGEVTAVVLTDGRARLRPLGPVEPVTRTLAQVAFALRRLADRRRPAASLAGAGLALTRAGDVLDALLLRPLAGVVADRSLVVVPTPALQSLPWSLLPSCAGRPVTVAPSASLWHEAHRRAAAVGRVVVVAGPGLPGARAEAAAVAALHPGAQRLVDGDAAAPRVAAALDGAALVHVAAHGRLRSDNPLFSALVLDDGPFTVYDLERLGTAPAHVVLAACDTGRSHSVAGGEILGLTAALLGQGTATLVAPVVPVPDAETVELMRAYHGQLRAGLSPAEALAHAQQRSASLDGVARAAAAGFLCLGDGSRAPALNRVPEPREPDLAQAVRGSASP